MPLVGVCWFALCPFSAAFFAINLLVYFKRGGAATPCVRIDGKVPGHDLTTYQESVLSPEYACLAQKVPGWIFVDLPGYHSISM